jgi:hypothetical protein
VKKNDLINFINDTCVYSNFRVRLKKLLMPTLGLYGESVDILIVAPIN